MQSKITIVFPFRDRDAERVEQSFLSLHRQTVKDFEVLFIDYGSTLQFSEAIKLAADKFSFVKYKYVAHEGLLWNKSIALNYGIRQAASEFIVMADVDVIFSANFIERCKELSQANKFSLFKIGYLPKSSSNLNITTTAFKDLKPSHIGDTFGIGLFPKQALVNVAGLDSFFHFYGSEDEDLNHRLQLSGCELLPCKELFLLHQWHPRYPRRDDRELTIIPRLENIQRINQRHFKWHKKHKVSIHNDSQKWGQCYLKKDKQTLARPHRSFVFSNIKSHVTHFLNYELNTYQNEIIKVTFKEDAYSKSIMYRFRSLLKKETQPYVSLKYINDRILEKIIFSYRHHNYSYKVFDDLKKIDFTIDLSSS